MKKEYQVCSLEYAKKLKELGVKQDSLFYWEQCIAGIHKDKTQYGGFALISKKERQLIDIANTSAFTVAELGEMLPKKIKKIFNLEIREVKYGWEVDYKDIDNNNVRYFSEINLSNAMAKMLIYLLENKLI